MFASFQLTAVLYFSSIFPLSATQRFSAGGNCSNGVCPARGDRFHCQPTFKHNIKWIICVQNDSSESFTVIIFV